MIGVLNRKGTADEGHCQEEGSKPRHAAHRAARAGGDVRGPRDAVRDRGARGHGRARGDARGGPHPAVRSTLRARSGSPRARAAATPRASCPSGAVASACAVRAFAAAADVTRATATQRSTIEPPFHLVTLCVFLRMRLLTNSMALVVASVRSKPLGISKRSTVRGLIEALRTAWPAFARRSRRSATHARRPPSARAATASMASAAAPPPAPSARHAAPRGLARPR